MSLKCEICFQEGPDLNKCAKCQRAAHPSCYQFKNKVCEGCFCKVETDLACKYCGNAGLLTQVNSTEWGHLICTLLSEELMEVNFKEKRFRGIGTNTCGPVAGSNCKECKKQCFGTSYTLCCRQHKGKDSVAVHYFCLLKSKRWHYKIKTAMAAEDEDIVVCTQFNKVANDCLKPPKPKPHVLKDLAQFRQQISLSYGQLMLYATCCTSEVDLSYCHCKQQKEEQVVECDHCHNWLHKKCVGYKNQDVYLCAHCKPILERRELPDRLDQMPFLLTFREFLHYGQLLQESHQQIRMKKILFPHDNQKINARVKHFALNRKERRGALIQRIIDQFTGKAAKSKSKPKISQSSVKPPRSTQLESSPVKKQQIKQEANHEQKNRCLNLIDMKISQVSVDRLRQEQALVKAGKVTDLVGYTLLNSWPKVVREQQVTAVKQVCLLQHVIRDENFTLSDQQGHKYKLYLKKEGFCKLSKLFQAKPKEMAYQILREAQSFIKETENHVLLMNGANPPEYLEGAIQKVVNGWYKPLFLDKVISDFNNYKITNSSYQKFQQQVNKCQTLNSLGTLLQVYSYYSDSATYKEAKDFLNFINPLTNKLPTSMSYLQKQTQNRKIKKLLQEGVNKLYEFPLKPIVKKWIQKLRSALLNTKISAKFYEHEKKNAFGSIQLENMLRLMTDCNYPDNILKLKLKSYNQIYSMIRLSFQRLLSQKPTLTELQEFLINNIQRSKVKPVIQVCLIELLISQAEKLQSQVESIYDVLQSHPISQVDPQTFSHLQNTILYLRKLNEQMKVRVQANEKLLLCQRIVDAYNALHEEVTTVDCIVRITQFVKKQECLQSNLSLYLMNRQTLLQITQRGKPALMFYQKCESIEKSCQSLILAQISSLERNDSLEFLLNIKQKLSLYTVCELRGILGELKGMKLQEPKQSKVMIILRTEEKLVNQLDHGHFNLTQFRERLMALLILPVLSGRQKTFVKIYKNQAEIENHARILVQSLSSGCILRDKDIMMLQKCTIQHNKGPNTIVLSKLFTQYKAMHTLLRNQMSGSQLSEMWDLLARVPPYLVSFFQPQLRGHSQKILLSAEANGRLDDVFQLFRTFKRKRVKIQEGEILLKAVIEKESESLDSEQSKSEDEEISSSSSEIATKPQQIQVID